MKKLSETVKREIISWVIFLPTALILCLPMVAVVQNKTLRFFIGFFIGMLTMWVVEYFVAKYRNKRERRHEYKVRMCANCGCEEEMHFTERWCKRCREE